MWVVFRKSDRTVIGTSALARKDPKKSVAIRQAVQGLAGGGKVTDFDAVQVENRAEALALFGSRPGQKIVLEEAADGTLRPQVEEQEAYSLVLTTDVTDRHPVDGVALIPADGTSTATITVKKLDRQDQEVTRASDDDELWLRTDHGTIQDAQGKALRSLRLNKGTASFQLRSETSFRVATVQVLSADPGLENAAIRIEFA